MRAAVHGLVLLVAGPAFAGAGDFVRAPIVVEEFGVYCPLEKIGEVPAPDTERGVIDLIDGVPRLIMQGEIVPAELGIAFGLRFRLDGEESAAPTGDIATITVTHPPFGTPPVAVERYPTTIGRGTSSMTQFRFDDPYEMALGAWTIEISVDGETLVRQSFTVVSPEVTPTSLDLCEGPALMS